MNESCPSASLSMLFRLKTAGLLPDFVLQDHLLDQKEAEGLPSSCFADPQTRTLPIHTKGNTWVSMAVFNASDAPRNHRQFISGMLDKAAKFWEMTEEEQRTAKEALNTIQKTAEAESVGTVDYIIKQGSREMTVSKTVIYNRDQLQKTAEHLLQNRTRFPFYTRSMAAKQLLTMMDTHRELGLEAGLKSELQKMAGIGTTDVDTASHVIRSRALLYRKQLREKAEMLSKVAELVKDHQTDGLVHPDFLQKVSELLDTLDRSSGYHQRYSGTFRAPELDMFRITPAQMTSIQKQAAVLTDGSLVPLQKIAEKQTEVYNLLTRLGIPAENTPRALANRLQTVPPALISKYFRNLLG